MGSISGVSSMGGASENAAGATVTVMPRPLPQQAPSSQQPQPQLSAAVQPQQPKEQLPAMQPSAPMHRTIQPQRQVSAVQLLSSMQQQLSAVPLQQLSSVQQQMSAVQPMASMPQMPILQPTTQMSQQPSAVPDPMSYPVFPKQTSRAFLHAPQTQPPVPQAVPAPKETQPQAVGTVSTAVGPVSTSGTTLAEVEQEHDQHQQRSILQRQGAHKMSVQELVALQPPGMSRPHARAMRSLSPTSARPQAVPLQHTRSAAQLPHAGGLAASASSTKLPGLVNAAEGVALPTCRAPCPGSPVSTANIAIRSPSRRCAGEATPVGASLAPGLSMGGDARIPMARMTSAVSSSQLGTGAGPVPSTARETSPVRPTALQPPRMAVAQASAGATTSRARETSPAVKGTAIHPRMTSVASSVGVPPCAARDTSPLAAAHVLVAQPQLSVVTSMCTPAGVARVPQANPWAAVVTANAPGSPAAGARMISVGGAVPSDRRRAAPPSVSRAHPKAAVYRPAGGNGGRPVPASAN